MNEVAAGLLGAVLAGGASRRFGRDKAVEPIEGITLADRAATTLASRCTTVVIVGPDGLSARWPSIHDLRPACGPLGAIEAALAHAEKNGLSGAIVLACDLPLVTAATVARLAERFGVDGGVVRRTPLAVAVAADRPDGVEPLCAAYSVLCLPRVRALLDARILAARALHADVHGIVIPRPSGELLNVNTLADRAVAEERLRGPPSEPSPPAFRAPRPDASEA